MARHQPKPTLALAKPMFQRKNRSVRGRMRMSKEVASLRYLIFCLALVISAPARADHTVPVEIIGSVGIDGSGAIQEAGVVQVMFKGKTPPHGFQICASTAPMDTLFFSDVGPGPFDNVSYFELQPGTC